MQKRNYTTVSKILFTSILTLHLGYASAAESLSDHLEKKTLTTRIRDEIASLDINIGADLADVELATGVNLAAKYRYEVEASYQDQFYTRIDKWDLNAGINVGDVVNNFVDMPFSFSINRQNSFLFVRQFKSKKEAVVSIPYTPAKLPLTADLALKNLNPGDFVSMPANLNIAVEARATTSYVAPVILNANAGVFFVLSGEFIVQIFKIDETKVRLKMISSRGYNTGATAGAGLSFQLFGIRILDKQVDRMFDRDLAQLGYVINPGAQFIVDYVFDLKNEESKDAYNQILKTTLKFKDVAVLNKFDGANELKDKLISSFEKAEKIFDEDRALEAKDRRVSRIFKGFNDFKATTKKVKMNVLLASYNKDRAFTDNKVTYIDKNENNLAFYYPAYSKYIESKLGRGLLELKDQSYQNNFGLIPRFNSEDVRTKNPDFGITFERRDTLLSEAEQRVLQRFMIGQIPPQFGKLIDFSQWIQIDSKRETRVFFQMVLKAQAFNYIRNISKEDLTAKLIKYTTEKKKLHIQDHEETQWQKLKDFLFISRFVKNERIKELASDLYTILKDEDQNSETMLRSLVKLNDSGIFDKIGVGFLISLLPQDKLNDLMYLKLEMAAQNLKPISYEYGKLNYRPLYNELTMIQSRIANRSYDLRITEQDHTVEKADLDFEKRMIVSGSDEFDVAN